MSDGSTGATYRAPRRKSKAWLLAHNYKSEDDGDL